MLLQLAGSDKSSSAIWLRTNESTLIEMRPDMLFAVAAAEEFLRANRTVEFLHAVVTMQVPFQPGSQRE